MAGCRIDLEIVPFRGEYYEVKPERRYLVRNLIYPVPDPRFPFLCVHFTRRIDGSVEAGPNALLALSCEGYTGSAIDLTEALATLRYSGFWKMARMFWHEGLEEQYRAWAGPAFTRALQQMVPELTQADLAPALS
jgi:L-2-hydroxyglutarate oxidase